MEQMDLGGVTSTVSATSADASDAPNCGSGVADDVFHLETLIAAANAAVIKNPYADRGEVATAYKIRRKSTGAWSRGGSRPFDVRRGAAGKVWSQLGHVRQHLRMLKDWGPVGILADMEVVELRSSGLFAGKVVPALELL